MACEFSGVVRDAFRARGHDAFSCDLLPTEADPAFHFQRSVTDVLNQMSHWDLLIAHPPCTYLTNAGVRWLYKGGRGAEHDPKRWNAMHEASCFFNDLWLSDIPRICIENPIPHRHAGLDKPTQIIQPWQFGHGETKATCLWLKRLPKLEPTNIVSGREARVRSRTLPGIADAMAEQWG